jgi:hypothetical protein
MSERKQLAMIAMVSNGKTKNEFFILIGYV